jgi:hypothetical protein
MTSCATVTNLVNALPRLPTYVFGNQLGMRSRLPTLDKTAKSCLKPTFKPNSAGISDVRGDATILNKGRFSRRSRRELTSFLPLGLVVRKIQKPPLANGGSEQLRNFAWQS